MCAAKAARPKAILFDLDDTLISFEGVSEQAWEKCCEDFLGRHDLGIERDALLQSIHATRKWFWGDPERHKRGRRDMLAARREIVSLAMGRMGVRDTLLSNELADAYSFSRNELIHVFPRTVSTLEQLRNKGFRLGLLTNGTSEEQRSKLERFGLSKYFEVILVEGEIGFGKPDVRVYEKALSLLKLTPDEVWMIGDNLVWDVRAPQTIGIFSIWNDYLKQGLPSTHDVTPDHSVNDVSELIDLIETLYRTV